MDRRTFFAAGGALALTAATGAAAAPAHASAAPAETVRGPMFSWSISGGFVPPGVGVLVPPPLVVYHGGLAIADASRALDLSGRAERDLQRHAAEVLRDKRNSTRRPGAPIVADVPADILEVRDERNDVFRAGLDGWVMAREQRVFPKPMYELYDHVAPLRRKVSRQGQPWRPDAVLLVAVHLDLDPKDAKRWPDEVPLPPVGEDVIYKERKLRHKQARAVKRLIPHTDEGVWSHYRTRAGAFVSVNWRYLLPHE
ncbi:hypothetical protein [Virgisporangium aliadipatigenens]|uniref:hypothetical protein n=1 Tax=Virgisporangium aliadipatigenens TaxID=741659 RepID=UPI0019431C9C|nr:hypothetical protein [Virgisporangium aliadipatigenens]